MSATARSDVRRKDDFYETQPWCVDLLLDAINLPKTVHVCEPCAGQGAIVRRLLVHGYTSIEAIELDAGRAGCMAALPVTVQVGDATTLRPHATPAFTITNPPYGPAQAIIAAALTYTRGVVAMLTRLDFVAPKKRRFLFTRWGLPDLLVFERRPSYVKNVTWLVLDHKGKPLARPFDTKKSAEDFRGRSKRAASIKRRVVNNDSCEYAWVIWGLPGGGGRWDRLHNGDNT